MQMDEACGRVHCSLSAVCAARCCARLGNLPLDTLSPFPPYPLCTWEQEFKGYVFKIMGGQDKQGFPMKQGVLTNGRVQVRTAARRMLPRPCHAHACVLCPWC